VAQAVADGITTPDLGGPFTTQQVTDAIFAHLG
jgi:isocitrate/isopropylmalate dehydrogenase